jgi:hypothetical protein
MERILALQAIQIQDEEIVFGCCSSISVKCESPF